jgi:hypothetical protein
MPGVMGRESKEGLPEYGIRQLPMSVRPAVLRKNLSEDRKYLDRDTNPECPEYEAHMLRHSTASF